MNCKGSIGQKQCTHNATLWLVDENNKPVPGGWVCENCADNIISEYREKADMHWSTTKILDEYGTINIE